MIGFGASGGSTNRAVKADFGGALDIVSSGTDSAHPLRVPGEGFLSRVELNRVANLIDSSSNSFMGDRLAKSADFI
jgi:hypothetical protein